MLEEMLDSLSFDSSKMSADEFWEQLMKLALDGEKHTEYKLINNYEEYITAKFLLKTLKKLSKGFKKIAKAYYNDYVTCLYLLCDDLNLLYNFKANSMCAKFYEEEYELVKDIVDEFDTYMWDGHLFSMLCGDERPYEDYHEWRKKKNGE